MYQNTNIANDGHCLFRSISFRLRLDKSDLGVKKERGDLKSFIGGHPELRQWYYSADSDFNRYTDMHKMSGGVVWGSLTDIMVISFARKVNISLINVEQDMNTPYFTAKGITNPNTMTIPLEYSTKSTKTITLYTNSAGNHFSCSPNDQSLWPKYNQMASTSSLIPAKYSYSQNNSNNTTLQNQFQGMQITGSPQSHNKSPQYSQKFQSHASTISHHHQKPSPYSQDHSNNNNSSQNQPYGQQSYNQNHQSNTYHTYHAPSHISTNKPHHSKPISSTPYAHYPVTTNNTTNPVINKYAEEQKIDDNNTQSHHYQYAKPNNTYYHQSSTQISYPATTSTTHIVPSSISLKPTTSAIKQDVQLLIDNNLKYKQTEANYINYPPNTKDITLGVSIIAIGDLHSCAIKLVYFLIKYKLIQCSNKGYTAIYSAYISNDVDKFCKLLISETKVGVMSNPPLIIMIGDTLGDRGQDDMMILKTYELLHIYNLNYLILFSNHDMEFVMNYKKGQINKGKLLVPFSLDKYEIFAKSLVSLHKSISIGKVSTNDLDILLNTVYFPHLTLIYQHQMTYDYNKKGLIIFTHAPNEIQFIEKCHRALCPQTLQQQIPTKIESLDKLINMIKEINSSFNIDSFVKLNENYKPQHINQYAKYPLLKFLWNREFKQEHPIQYKHIITFVHGHVGELKMAQPYLHNLDSNFGKEFFNSHPLPVAMIQKLT
ncbi:MAG: hypothetical protein GY750_14185 [Lentisphaerae bacterium]|nr:hypothetical protein [Lentisphaerota bacterium]